MVASVIGSFFVKNGDYTININLKYRFIVNMIKNTLKNGCSKKDMLELYECNWYVTKTHKVYYTIIASSLSILKRQIHHSLERLPKENCL